MDTATGLVAVVPVAASFHGICLSEPFLSKPLWRYTLDHALQSPEIERTLLVVDESAPLTIPADPRLLTVPSVSWRQGVTWMSVDYTALEKAAAWYEKKEATPLRYVMYLNPLFPLRHVDHTMESFQRLLIDAELHAMAAVIDRQRDPLQPSVYCDRDGRFVNASAEGAQQKWIAGSMMAWQRGSLAADALQAGYAVRSDFGIPATSASHRLTLESSWRNVFHDSIG